MEREVPVPDRSAGDHLVQFGVLELFRAGPREQFLAVHQRDFQAQIIQQLVAMFGQAALRSFDPLDASVVGLSPKGLGHLYLDARQQENIGRQTGVLARANLRAQRKQKQPGVH